MHVTIVSYNKQKLTTQKAAASIPPYFPKLLSHIGPTRIRASEKIPPRISWVILLDVGFILTPVGNNPVPYT